MCLGVPGQVVSITEAAESLQRSGKISFGGVVKEVSLAFVPDVQVGEYVIVHAGFALNKLDEREAARIFAYLGLMDELAELEQRAS
jgi:hydrogenase expression/formation protein HypC